MSKLPDTGYKQSAMSLLLKEHACLNANNVKQCVAI
jgi:hypothetical protein